MVDAIDRLARRFDPSRFESAADGSGGAAPADLGAAVPLVERLLPSLQAGRGDAGGGITLRGEPHAPVPAVSALLARLAPPPSSEGDPTHGLPPRHGAAGKAASPLRVELYVQESERIVRHGDAEGAPTEVTPGNVRHRTVGEQTLREGASASEGGNVELLNGSTTVDVTLGS